MIGQFGSKGQKQRAAPNLVDKSDRKPAALETASVLRTMSAANTGTDTLDTPIPKKLGKEMSTKAAAVAILSANAKQSVSGC